MMATLPPPLPLHPPLPQLSTSKSSLHIPPASDLSLSAARLQALREVYGPAWGPPLPPPRAVNTIGGGDGLSQRRGGGKGKQRAGGSEGITARNAEGKGRGDEEDLPRITVIEAPISPPRSAPPQAASSSSSASLPAPRADHLCPACSPTHRPLGRSFGGLLARRASSGLSSSSSFGSLVRAPLFEDSDEDEEESSSSYDPKTSQPRRGSADSNDQALSDNDEHALSNDDADDDGESTAAVPLDFRLRRSSSFSPSKHLSPLSAPYRSTIYSSTSPPPSLSPPPLFSPKSPPSPSQGRRTLTHRASSPALPQVSATNVSFGGFGWRRRESSESSVSPGTTVLSASASSPSSAETAATSWRPSGDEPKWFAGLPAHRRAVLSEARAWPIFASTISSSPRIEDSTLDARRCAGCGAELIRSTSTVTSAETAVDDQEEDEGEQKAREESVRNPLRRKSSAVRLDAPGVELHRGDSDPLLSPPSKAQQSSTAERSQTTTSPLMKTSLQPRRRSSSGWLGAKTTPSTGTGAGTAGGKKESLLTKSLKQLGGRLPNLQWGNSPSPPPLSSAVMEGDPAVRRPMNAADFAAAPGGASVVRPSGNSWEGGVGIGQAIGAGVGLSDVWAADLVAAGRGGHWDERRFCDPELEWSSMMVQLDTFALQAPAATSPTAASSPTPLPASPSLRRTTLALSPPSRTRSSSPRSKPSHSSQADSSERSTSLRKRRSRSSLVLATSPPRPGTPPLSRSASSPEIAQTRSPSPPPASTPGTIGTRRLLSNPYHLLQLTLELEMMRGRKIRAPLRQRAIKVVVVVGDERADGERVGGGEEVWVVPALGGNAEGKLKGGGEAGMRGMAGLKRKESGLRREVLLE